jgi:diguanylate cyclase (GGDEF)-like protein/hemerythrin-like metal-binding protein
MTDTEKVACGVATPGVDLPSIGLHLLNSSAFAVAVARQGRIIFANPAFQAEFRASGSLVGTALRDVVIDRDQDELQNSLLAAETMPITYFGTGRRGDDDAFDLELRLEALASDGAPTVIVFASDITQLRRSMEQLHYLAYSDALTGVANRARFADRLHEALLRARRCCAMLAVLMIDLDGFKAINDRHGHDAGDVALQLVARRFQHCTRDGDTLARLGGDEFALLLPQLSSEADAAWIALRMIDALKEPLDLGTEKVVVGTSIGIAMFPDHAGQADALLAAADTALYRAKRSGKNRFQWATGQFSADALCVDPLTWNAAHAVGIREIDEQHAHLAGLIDTLAVALKDSTDRRGMLAQLEKVVDYAELHFAAEERLMADHQVDNLVAHRDAHRRLLEDIRKLDVANDLASISLMMRYLREWLLRHVDSFDRKLALELIAKGCT